MSGAQVSLLLGLFGVPAVLLWLGQHFRRRSRTQRAVFWGGVVGHSLALVVTVAVALTPPVGWSDGARRLVVHGALLAGAIVGAALAAVYRRLRH